MLKERGAIPDGDGRQERGLLGDGIAVAGKEAAETEENPEEAEAKIIVRSNGTVTYVGKDIAYHLWKFGLLGRDFRYQTFKDALGGPQPWVTTSGAGQADAPAFGQAQEVYNVIDTRQAYPLGRKWWPRACARAGVHGAVG